MHAVRLLALLIAGALLGAPALAQKRERDAAAGQLSAVGNGKRVARQGLQPGAYITPRHRQAVNAWVARHHGPGQPCLPGLTRAGQACVPPAGEGAWVIGNALPRAAKLRPVPTPLREALPPPPPGNRYTLWGGDILLVASASRIVVDAVPVP